MSETTGTGPNPVKAPSTLLGIRKATEFKDYFNKYKLPLVNSKLMSSDSLTAGRLAKSVLSPIWGKMFISQDFMHATQILAEDLRMKGNENSGGLWWQSLKVNAFPFLKGDILIAASEKNTRLGKDLQGISLGVGMPAYMVNDMVNYLKLSGTYSGSTAILEYASNHVRVCEFTIKWFNAFLEELYSVYPELKGCKQIKGFPKLTYLTDENYMDAFHSSVKLLKDGKVTLDDADVTATANIDDTPTALSDLITLKSLVWKALQGYFLVLNKDTLSLASQKAIDENRWYETFAENNEMVSKLVDDVMHANMMYAAYTTNKSETTIDKSEVGKGAKASTKVRKPTFEEIAWDAATKQDSSVTSLNVQTHPFNMFKDIKTAMRQIKAFKSEYIPRGFLTNLTNIMIEEEKTSKSKTQGILKNDMQEFVSAYRTYIEDLTEILMTTMRKNRGYFGDGADYVAGLIGIVKEHAANPKIGMNTDNMFSTVEALSFLFAGLYEKDAQAACFNYIHEAQSLVNASMLSSKWSKKVVDYFRSNIHHFIMTPSQQGKDIPVNVKNEYFDRFTDPTRAPGFLSNADTNAGTYTDKNKEFVLRSCSLFAPMHPDLNRSSDTWVGHRDSASRLFLALVYDLADESIPQEVYQDNNYNTELAHSVTIHKREQVAWAFSYEAWDSPVNHYFGVLSDFPYLFNKVITVPYVNTYEPGADLDNSYMATSVIVEQGSEKYFTKVQDNKYRTYSEGSDEGDGEYANSDNKGIMALTARIPGYDHAQDVFGFNSRVVYSNGGVYSGGNDIDCNTHTPTGDFFEGDLAYHTELYNMFTYLSRRETSLESLELFVETSRRSEYYRSLVYNSYYGGYTKRTGASVIHCQYDTDGDYHSYDYDPSKNFHATQFGGHYAVMIGSNSTGLNYPVADILRAYASSSVSLFENTMPWDSNIVHNLYGVKRVAEIIATLEKNSAFAQPFTYEVRCFPTDGLFVIFEELKKKLDLDFSNKEATNMSEEEAPSSDDRIEFLMLKDSKGKIHKVPEGNIPVKAQSLLPERLHQYLGEDEHYIELLRTDKGISLHGVLPSYVVSLIERSITNFDELLQKYSIILNNSVIIDDFKNVEYIDLNHISAENYIMSEYVKQDFQPILSRVERTEECVANGVDLKFGVLLEGPYGTGKSMTAFYLGKIAIDNGWTFIYIRNSTEANILKTLECLGNYQKASKGLLVFVEDIDRIISDREGDANKIVNVLDGGDTKFQKVIVIFTTNHLEVIDPSILRGKRISKVINIPAVDETFAHQFLRFFPDNLLEKPKAEMTLEEQKEFMSPIIGFVSAFAMEIIDQAKAISLYQGTKITKEIISAIANDYEEKQVKLARLNKKERNTLADAARTLGQHMLPASTATPSVKDAEPLKKSKSAARNNKEEKKEEKSK